MNCRICNYSSARFAKASVLKQYAVDYYRCPRCGFVQTETPYWLDAAYAEAITKSDIGLAGRSISSARLAAVIIERFYNGNERFLDYGGGYGLMVRLMRDAGFNFFREDRFCANLFARGFDVDEVQADLGRFELVTAFEVFEHMMDPAAEIAKILKYSRNVLFSTTLLPEPSPMPEQWWYYGVEHGQHVSLYTRKALTMLGGQHGLYTYSDNRSLHMFTDRKLSEREFRVVTRFGSRIAPILAIVKRRASYLPKDYNSLTGQALT